MKRAALGERKPLQEKQTFGCVPADRCYICNKAKIKSGVSSVTSDVKGTKYIGGVEYMLVDEIEKLSTVVYCREFLNTSVCTCVVPSRPLAPIGTKFTPEKSFRKGSLCPKVPMVFLPSFFEYSPYRISVESVIRGLDSRTTCMIKNIPNKLTTRQLVAFLSSICFNSFDFLYLRMDFKSSCNNGYAFINFRRPKYIPMFLEAIEGRRWKNFRSEKKGEIAYARIQGLSMLQNRFRRSDILSACPEYWPVLFDRSGNEMLASEWKS